MIMALNSPTQPSGIYSVSKNPGGLCVFCDVDGTLYENVETHELNQNLIDAWKEAGITEIYLYTSMSANEPKVVADEKNQIGNRRSNKESPKNRKDIIAKLHEQGIHVKAVCTTFDLYLDAVKNIKPLQTFDKFKKDSNVEREIETNLDAENEALSRAGKTPLSSEMVSQLKVEILKELELMYDAVHKKYTSDKNINVIGNYYKEYIEPHYLITENNLAFNAKYQATKMLQEHYFRSNTINQIKANRSKELGVPDNLSAAGEKVGLTKLLQDEAAQQGNPIRNYVIFEDAKDAMIHIPKVAAEGVASHGVWVNFTNTAKDNKAHYLGNTLFAIQKGDPKHIFDKNEKMLVKHAKSLSDNFNEEQKLIEDFKSTANKINTKYTEVGARNTKNIVQSGGRNISQILSQIQRALNDQNKISKDDLNQLNRYASSLSRAIEANKAEEIAEIRSSYLQFSEQINQKYNREVCKPNEIVENNLFLREINQVSSRESEPSIAAKDIDILKRHKSRCEKLLAAKNHLTNTTPNLVTAINSGLDLRYASAFDDITAALKDELTRLQRNRDLNVYGTITGKKDQKTLDNIELVANALNELSIDPETNLRIAKNILDQNGISSKTKGKMRDFRNRISDIQTNNPELFQKMLANRPSKLPPPRTMIQSPFEKATVSSSQSTGLRIGTTRGASPKAQTTEDVSNVEASEDTIRRKLVTSFHDARREDEGPFLADNNEKEKISPSAHKNKKPS